MDIHLNYHRSLMGALNPAKGRPLVIRGELGQAASMNLLEEIARRDYGAGPVTLLYIDPVHDASVVRQGDFLEIDTMYDSLRAVYREVVAQRGSLMRLTGSQYPELDSQLAAEHSDAHQRWMSAQSAAAELHRNYGVNKGFCTWLVAGAAQEGWARKVHPQEGDGALARLWDNLYDVTWAKCADPNAERRALDEALHRRSAALNALDIDRFQVTGPGTDWTVGLHPLARFRSGGGSTADGRYFNANTPSYEVWVTPDRLRAEGELSFTMPFLANGVVVEGLKVRMEKGAVVECHATRGLEEFKRHIAMDEGAKYGGEFALVGIDSPLYRMKTLFYSTLYDENAASHWAFGNGYADCIEGGQSMTPAQLREVGCNTSKIHTDAMWGSDQIDVVAHTRDGREIPVLVKGVWQSPFGL
jgi:aminopeptidase